MENDDGIVLSLSVDPEVLEKSCTIVTSEQLSLPFSFDATVVHDFHGKSRRINNTAGPFSNLQKGANEIPIYEFTSRYKKALKLVNAKQ